MRAHVRSWSDLGHWTDWYVDEVRFEGDTVKFVSNEQVVGSRRAYETRRLTFPPADESGAGDGGSA